MPVSPIHLRAAVLALACLAASAQNQQSAGGPRLSRMERQLTARIRWELLWNDPPVLGSIPSSSALAVYSNPRVLFYCSHDLGRCVQYRVEDRQLGQRLKAIACGGNATACKQGQTDAESLASFVQQVDPTLSVPIMKSPASGYTLGGNLAGLPAPTGAQMWEMKAAFGTKQQIADEYRRARPAELESLKAWSQDRLQGYRSVTIPCFIASDPEIYTYGDRVSGGPIITTLAWDPEEEEWRVLGFLDDPRSASKIQEMKLAIESMACATVKLDGTGK